MVATQRRTRGEIIELPSGSLYVKVYSGIDPVTRRKHYLNETIPAGPGAAKAAEKARTRLLNQVDERRNPKTSATVNQLIDRWLEVLDVEVSTRDGYVKKIEKHVRPRLGQLKVSRLGVEELESFYAALRRCRDHCQGKAYVVHRKGGEHVCTAVCRPHECRGLANATIRQIHWIISGFLDAGRRWGWVSLNYADQAKKPAMPRPEPNPPTPEEAAQLVNEAYAISDDWGAYVWVAMTVGCRRAEECALHLEDVDLASAVLDLRRGLFMAEDRTWLEKDTKSHQQRRIALDEETVEVIREQVDRQKERAKALGIKLPKSTYLFSPDLAKPLNPDTATQKFERMARRLGIDATLHCLRHYTATELIDAGVDVRAVAGRLGHSGGGATTLRVYAKWLSEADQRAAKTMSGRMPARPRKAT